ncbi:DNA polymerase III subunit delta [Rubrobacter naiadicus]|uniref:DNA polymerase III subunit delta n=1 Tax=Rubrobacter naiadicus TaxID=1392641 RepID=UPI00236163AA|nr:DNA polymerase III subunit delta [Rubrobacter naiadicus]
MGVYLLLGDDEERKRRGVERLRRGRDAVVLDAGASSPEEAVSACNSYPLFGEGSFVVVRGVDAWNAAQKDVITRYLEDPAGEADLVLLARKLGARERLRAAVEKVGEVHEFEQPTGRALARWAARRAKELGAELPEDVAAELARRCSEDKLRMIPELEKLALYREGGRIGREDLDALCPPDVQSNIFAFVDALAEGRRRRALEALARLFATGEPPLRVVYMMRRQFRLVGRALALVGEGAAPRELAGQLGVPPFVARKLAEQARNLDPAGVERALSVLLALEGGLKGRSDLEARLQVELATIELCRERAS